MNADELHEIARAEREAQAAFEHRIIVCSGTGCQSLQSEQLVRQLEGEIRQRGLERRCSLREGGCRGLCAEGPLVTVESQDVLYQRVTPDDAPALIDSLESGPIERLRCDTTMPFFTAQKKIVLEHNGMLDPERIEAYIAKGGFSTFIHVLTEMTPAQVIEQITRSGLRGRGGAGYPTGLKWSTVAKAAGEHKYVVCNGDEGDPGAFMDRSVMEDAPYQLIEGMLIAAYAVGADAGFLYVRAEYPLAVKRLKHAIRQAEKHGLLGHDICGTRFSFKLDVRLGAGAFVCGEETALIASIEGKRGQPRPRPPYPAEHGLWGYPTLINNVETFANIMPILRDGGDLLASIGTERSKGTKVFALTGSVERTGLIEVPMGISLRKIVYEIGGIPEGKRFKAVQTGGPSGGCIPEEHLDITVDYESLAKVGSFMGSGGMIVMDESACMVDVAKFFVEFCMSESCGKCIPCRVGTAQMYRLLEKITQGEATLDDLALLEELCDMVKHTSLCGLGQGAPNPVMSTLRYFRAEYLAHIVDHVCPAGVCHALKAKEPV
ncbi:NuoF family protein [Oscillatoria laete-virens NRMC-F 0139]|jgi:bidirectional [NiFe] hydrogenase diaphorase subunit|nr:NuoF family protein [Oscillatoria laete-virens]MDL5055432.1 NuoF family protein [Oscillatoria laete-virens NRMC-F 0139]